MQNTNITYIGVDIAKSDFVADISGTTAAFEQSPKAYARFIKRLPPNACVVCEATGGYEQPLVQALHAARVPVALVMPKRVRFYAKSLGLLAKNDPIDAGLTQPCAGAPRASSKSNAWAKSAPGQCSRDARTNKKANALQGLLRRRREEPPPCQPRLRFHPVFFGFYEIWLD